MTYDDASWHYEGTFPDDLPNSAGATHIGMYVAWAIISGLGADPADEEDAKDIAQLRSYELTPGQWLFEKRDGKFTSDDLNDEGRSFTAAYYANEKGPREGRNSYFADYEAIFKAGDEIYRVPDRWSNFYHLRARLEARLEMFRQFGQPFIPEGKQMELNGKTIGSVDDA